MGKFAEPLKAVGKSPASRANRPLGKRSNANYEASNLLLPKLTKFEANQILDRQRVMKGSAPDLSELVDTLLLAWIDQNKNWR